MGNSAAKRLNSIHSLRGAAAILVVLFHVTEHFQVMESYAFLSGIFLFGYTGVDFFFLLSGFVIFYIHHRDIGDPSRLREYSLKRFVRVFPIYWIVAVPIVILHLIRPMRGFQYLDAPGAIPLSLLLLPQESTPILPVSWTLTHELLFYVIFGLAILLDRRKSAALVGGWIVLTAVRPFLSSVIDFSNLWTFLLSPFNFEFLAGCIVAAIVIRGREFTRFSVPLLITVGMVLLVASVSMRLEESVGRQAAFTPPFFFILLGFAIWDRSVDVTLPYLLRLFGDAAYSIYLTHLLALQAIYKVFKAIGIVDSHVTLATVLTLVASIIVGCLLHLWVEKPVLLYLRRSVVERPLPMLQTSR